MFINILLNKTSLEFCSQGTCSDENWTERKTPLWSLWKCAVPEKLFYIRIHPMQKQKTNWLSLLLHSGSMHDKECDFNVFSSISWLRFLDKLLCLRIGQYCMTQELLWMLNTLKQTSVTSHMINCAVRQIWLRMLNHSSSERFCHCKSQVSHVSHKDLGL